MAEWIKSAARYVGISAGPSQLDLLGSNVDQSLLVLEGAKVTFDSKKVVGVGSFATVYQGKYKGNKCAVKVFNKGVVQKDIEKESRLASIVQHHPNVVLVHGLWCGNPANELPNDQPALVMELCSTNLWKYLNEKKDKGNMVLFSLHSKLEILRDVAAGMIYLHSVQIVHGDLKAINILLNVKGSEVVAAKVADFGQARVLDPDTLRHITAIRGRSDIMPPEVKDSQDQVELTMAVDVFSFGCLIPHVASCMYPEPRLDPLGAKSDYQMRIHYISDNQKHVFELIMRRCLEERPTARGTFEDAMEDIQIHLKKYAKNRQAETLEGNKRDLEKQKSDLLKLQRAHQDLQDEHDALADNYKRAQEEKDNMEGRWNALVGERDALADEKKALEHDVMLAKQEILQKEQRLKDLEKDKERSLSSVDSVGVVFQKYEETKDENKRLKDQVDELHSEFEQLHQQHRASEAKGKKYCQDVDYFQKEAARLSSELQESKRTVESMRRSKTAIEKQKQTVDKKCATLETELNASKKRCEKAERNHSDSMTKNQQLTAKNQEMTTAASKRTKELKELNDKIANLERQLKHTKELKEKADRERETAKSDGADTKRQLAECQSQLAKEQERCQLANNSLKTKNSVLEKLREDLQKKDNDLWAVRKEKEQYQGKAAAGDTTVKSQQQKLKEAQQKEQELNAKLREYHDDLEATKSAKDKLEKSKKTLEEEKTALDMRVRELTFKLEVRVEDLGKKEGKIGSLTRDLEDARKVIAKGETLEPVLRKQIKELEEEKKDLTNKLVRNVGKLKKTENDWEETKKAQKALEEERDEKTKSIRELQGKQDRLDSRIQELETKLDEMTTHNETLEKQCNEEAKNCRFMEKARDSADERADGLQTQLKEMHTELEKLRRKNMLILHERTDFIEELMESEHQKEADLDLADMDYQALKNQLKAAADDQNKAREQLELLKRSLDSISTELAVKERERGRIEEHLKVTRQCLKAKEEECYSFETAQLNLLQRNEDLQRENRLFKAQVAQHDAQLVQMRAEMAKTGAERDAFCSQLEEFATLKAENESLKQWKKKAKKVKEIESQLNKKQMELTTEWRVLAELKKKLDREFVTKTNLECAVEQSFRKSFTERGEELMAGNGADGSGLAGSEGSTGSVSSGWPTGSRNMKLLAQHSQQKIRAIEDSKREVEEAYGQKERETQDLQHKLRIAVRESVQLKNDIQDARKTIEQAAVKIRMLTESYFLSHKYPPFLYQLHQKGLPSSGTESTFKVEVSEIIDLRLYQPDAFWCDEFQLILDELKAMPSKKCQGCVSISFLQCGGVITFYRYHILLVPQILSCERDLHPIELEGGAKPKAMLVYAHTQLKSGNLKEFGIKVHPKGVLLQPEFEGNIPELAVSLDELEGVPAGLENTERCLDARILHQLQCRYKEFATPRMVHTMPPMGVAMAAL